MLNSIFPWLNKWNSNWGWFRLHWIILKKKNNKVLIIFMLFCSADKKKKENYQSPIFTKTFFFLLHLSQQSILRINEKFKVFLIAPSKRMRKKKTKTYFILLLLKAFLWIIFIFFFFVFVSWYEYPIGM